MQGIVGLLENYVAFLSPGAVFFSGLITRGGFVGVAVESVDLHRMRADLDELLASDLRAQDKKTYKPHVTITNLGSPGHALSCFKALETLFVPWQGEAIGLELFHYRRGHWQFAHDFPFRGLLPSPE